MKKALGKLCVVLLLIGGLILPSEQASASEVTVIDGSELTMESSAVGYAIPITRGVYFQSGDSTITKSGNGLISCNGTTFANRTCTVSVNVIVERLVGGSWARVTSWTATNNNAVYVTSTKTISVGSGYNYRTRSIHYAGSDSASSYTNGIYI